LRSVISLRIAETRGEGAAARSALLRLLRRGGVRPGASEALAKLDAGRFARAPRVSLHLQGLTRRAVAEIRAARRQRRKKGVGATLV
jgi:hypothetical protein